MYNNQGGQVYYDAETGQYYTMPYYGNLPTMALIGGSPWRSNNRTYIGSPFASVKDTSMVSKFLENRQPYQYNAPTSAQMFPSMNQFGNYLGNTNAGNYGGNLFGGGLLGSNAGYTGDAATSSGAGRFL